jgi:outer membrane protein assembly factor BamB
MRASLLGIFLLGFPVAAVGAPPGPADWATYNYDAVGWRHNVGEKTLGRDNVGRLVEKWRFPAKGSGKVIGPVHATPVVVGGYVYFGTALNPTFYKLTPDGKVKWSYTNADYRKAGTSDTAFGVPTSGFVSAALVTADTVYVGDTGGYIYALDRFTGEERWKIATRKKPFPGAHPSNCIFSAPVLADGKVIVAGGGFEHAAAARLKEKCCTGRGFIVALEPGTGKVVWKYEVGPEPGPLDPPVRVKYAGVERVYHFGPSTSSVWSTPSYDKASGRIFFGTDAHNAPRKPTREDPRHYTKHSCAVIALDVRTGKEQWVTQINPDDVWNYGLPGYDPKTGRYKDQSIGDTPKIYTIDVGGRPTKVVGVGCKNGGFYVLRADTGKVVRHTPVYTGPPVMPPKPTPDARMLALPGLIGGLQTGCATDGKAVYTNGIDILLMGTRADGKGQFHPPTGGRVVSISPDAAKENWRHERPKVKAVGGTAEEPAFRDVGDPVGSGIALANGVAYFTTTVSNQLVALDTRDGKVLKEIPLGPVWCGPSVSRGRVYVGTGNILFAPLDPKEAYFPKGFTGTVRSFGLPGEDEVSRLGGGKE